MDRLSELEALMGGDSFTPSPSSDENPWSNVKASCLYEGTDSDDDELIMGQGKHGFLNEKTGVITYKDGTTSNTKKETGVDTTKGFSFDLQQGELAPEGVRYMTFKTVTKYPYMFIGQANRQKVATAFFDKGQVYEHTYDLFYIYKGSDHNSQPIILVPTKQFEYLLSAINSKLKTKLTIPKGGAGDSFYIGFWKDGNPQPRYLGRCSSKDSFEGLKTHMPPFYYKLDGEPSDIGPPDERAVADFEEKLALMMINEKKGNKVASKEKKDKARVQRHQELGTSVKRVQCYIGIREKRDDTEAIQASLRNSNTGWLDVKAIARAVAEEATAKYGPPTFFNPSTTMKFTPQDSVVFIAVDVEAWEFNHKQITEIGVATLDTLDLVKLAPGDGGKSWMKQIRGRHFRIEEHKYLINNVHVDGCPDRFEFGKSEFISIKDAPSVIASCFKHPFSAEGEGSTLQQDNAPKRNIVLVGHAVSGDVTFLKSLGYDVTNLSNLKDTLDTADLWKYVKKDTNPTKLGAILYELGLPSWNLHNAGNDAVYTLQVMIGTAIKHLTDKDKPKLVLGKRLVERVAEVWEGGIEGEQPFPAPASHWNGVNVEETVTSTLTASQFDDSKEDHLDNSLPTGTQADADSPAATATEQASDVLLEDDRQVVTQQELSNIILNGPWSDEKDVIKMLAKFKIASA